MINHIFSDIIKSNDFSRNRLALKLINENLFGTNKFNKSIKLNQPLHQTLSQVTTTFSNSSCGSMCANFLRALWHTRLCGGIIEGIWHFKKCLLKVDDLFLLKVPSGKLI
jgi:hypothetical protein